MLRKKLKWISIFLLLLVLGRGFLFRATVKYHQIGERSITELNDFRMILKINRIVHGEQLAIDEAIETSLRLTTQQLSFTSEKKSNNPNDVCHSGKANCIGYAALFSAILNHFLASSDKYQVTHVVGRLSFLGYDIHQLTSNPFFRDHDYVEITDLESGETWRVDPSLSDYLGIHRIN